MSLHWRPDRGITFPMETVTNPCLTMKVDEQAAAESRGECLTIPARKPNKFIARFEAREAAAREREAREDAANIALLDSWGGKHGWCYFLGCDEGIVKIGYSRKLNARISAIQSQSLYKLTLLAVAGGGREREGIYHNRFKAHALGGEWFTRCPEIEAEIAHLNTIAQVPA